VWVCGNHSNKWMSKKHEHMLKPAIRKPSISLHICNVSKEKWLKCVTIVSAICWAVPRLNPLNCNGTSAEYEGWCCFFFGYWVSWEKKPSFMRVCMKNIRIDVFIVQTNNLFNKSFVAIIFFVWEELFTSYISIQRGCA
jgi:hypothetical protein